MGIRQPGFAFMSGISKHTVNSFGKDMGMHTFQDTVVKNIIKNGGKINAEHFGGAHSVFRKFKIALDTLNFVGVVTAGILDYDKRSPTNTGKSNVTFISQEEKRSIGKNDCMYYTTRVELGNPIGSKINRIKSGPFITTVTKTLKSSSEDYQSHEKRKQLQLKSGFNEKGFAFFMEDTYLSVKDYSRLYRIEKRFAKEIKNLKHGYKKIYGCGLKTYNQIIIRNRIMSYSAHVQIHMIKLLDLETDVRSLLQDITHNPDQYNSKNDIVDYVTYRSPYDTGKILPEDQYSDPDIKSLNKKFALDFRTSIPCSLYDSTKFQQKATIVRSWRATLAPGSTWEFNANCHLGNGINLNYITDILDDGNGNHPSGFIFCLEYIGDKRASIVKKSTGDVYMGISPTDLRLEFKLNFTYLTNEDKEDELLVTKINKRVNQFDEESEFADLFYPDRKEPFHVGPDDVYYYNNDYKNETDQDKFKNCEYLLEYNQSVTIGADSPSILESLKTQFENIGLDPEKTTENDINLNLKKDPSKDERSEYRGPDTPLYQNEEDGEEDNDDKDENKGFFNNLRKK